MSVAARSASAQRFAARARRQRLRRALRMLVLGAVVAGVGALAWLFGWSSVLAVEDVSVVGVSGERADEVLRLAEAPIGTPLARVDTGTITARVAELPEAAEVDVRRSWPNTLTIEVTPRTPVAAVSDGDAWWSVDDTGALFNSAPSRPEGLPVLDASASDSADDAAARAAGISVLTGLPPALLELVETVEARSAADVRLALTDGSTVRWGTAERIERKAEVLLALIAAQDEDEPPSSYDVSAPNHPAVTP